MPTSPRPRAAMPWFRPEQWDRLRELSGDRIVAAARYEDWLAHANAELGRLRREGLDVSRVEVDVEALNAWCLTRRLPMNGETCSQFVAEELERSGG